MKILNFYIIVLMPLLCFGCFGDNERKNDLTKNNLKGKVKSVEKTVYDAVEKDGEIEKSSLNYKRTERYNKDGYMVERKAYKSDSSLKDVCKFEYDTKGNLLEQIFTDEDGKYACKIAYKNNSNGMMIEEKLLSPTNKNAISTTTHKYDKKGRLIETIDWWTYKKSKAMWKYVLEYNEGGKISKETLYKDDRGRIREWENTLYDYNENGDKIKEVVKSTKFDPSHYTFSYEYDKVGNWTSRTKFFQGEPSEIVERTITYYN
jgi:hypothetical protein